MAAQLPETTDSVNVGLVVLSAPFLCSMCRRNHASIFTTVSRNGKITHCVCAMIWVDNCKQAVTGKYCVVNKLALFVCAANN